MVKRLDRLRRAAACHVVGCAFVVRSEIGGSSCDHHRADRWRGPTLFESTDPTARAHGFGGLWRLASIDPGEPLRIAPGRLFSVPACVRCCNAGACVVACMHSASAARGICQIPPTRPLVNKQAGTTSPRVFCFVSLLRSCRPHHASQEERKEEARAGVLSDTGPSPPFSARVRRVAL